LLGGVEINPSGEIEISIVEWMQPHEHVHEASEARGLIQVFREHPGCCPGTGY